MYQQHIPRNMLFFSVFCVIILTNFKGEYTMFFKLPKGENKKVYIDKEWLELSDIGYHPGFFLERLKVLQLLSKYGYDVIHDDTMIDSDTFFFTRCLNRRDMEYMEEALEFILEDHGIGYPKTIFVNTTTLSLCPLPFVFKNGGVNGGKEKYLIETKEQLERLKKFFQNMDKLVDNMDEIRNHIVFQEYIQTPTKFNTSLRVTTSSTGDILSADLKYNDKSIKEYDTKTVLTDYLENPMSEYYLNSKPITSNTVGGGSYIILKPHRKEYTEFEKEILKKHHIAEDGSLPSNVLDFCWDFSTELQEELGSVNGYDFIYDENKEQWYFLEEHCYPMLQAYCKMHNLPYLDNEEDSFDSTLYQVQADGMARIHALSLSMEKQKVKNGR